MTRVFYASTLFSAMGLAAASDAGVFGDRSERRLLIVSNNTNVPEISDDFVDSAAFVSLRQRFDDVVRWNEIIEPMHPSGWTPPAAEIPMLSRLLFGHLGITDGVSELVLESVAVAPARTIGMLIPDCPITVNSDGLMSYGPTRDELPPRIGRRTKRLLYLDLLPGIRPLLLRENDIALEPVPDDAFLKVIAELPEPDVADAQGCPVILGQYLSSLGLMSAQAEVELHSRMLGSIAAGGHRHIVFKPHPAAGSAHIRPLQRDAERLGVRLTIAGDRLPVESWFAAARPELVVSCFSTALLTASHYFGIPVATVGAERVLDRLTPYENSNRIPATIVDATVPVLAKDGALVPPKPRDLEQLLGAVGYCMQASRLGDLRPSAVSYLAEEGPGRYFKSPRLVSLDLIQSPTQRRAAARRVARRVARRGYGAGRRYLEIWRRRRASATSKRS